MSKNLDHDDLGIDLEHAKKLPVCDACRKQSDGSKSIYGFTLCGTHFDEVLRELSAAQLKTDRTRREYVGGFVYRLKNGPFKPCWEAKIDE